MELFADAEEEGHSYKNIAMLNQMVRFSESENYFLGCEEYYLK